MAIFSAGFTSQLDGSNLESHLTHGHTWADFGRQLFVSVEGQEVLIRSFDRDGDRKVGRLREITWLS